MYGLMKYFLYLVGNRFLFVRITFLNLFHPHKGILTIAANSLLRWALFYRDSGKTGTLQLTTEKDDLLNVVKQNLRGQTNNEMPEMEPYSRIECM